MMRAKGEDRHPPGYPLGEDIANSVTHGVGAVLSLIGTALLLWRTAGTGTSLHLASFSIYGLSLFLLSQQNILQ